MAIVISSLTPTNPTTIAGGSITFNIGASDSNNLTLSYEWQYSVDGVNYTSSGLSNNTSNTYDTGALTISTNGTYYRCVVSTSNETVNSNEYVGIGDRTVIVYQDPTIVTQVDSTVDFLPASTLLSVGDTLVLGVSASLANVDITNTSLVTNIGIQWQQSDDSGSTWTNLSTGGDVNIAYNLAIIDGTTNSYAKYSTLSIANITFAYNLYQFRVVVSYTGATNTPVNSTTTSVVIDPVINIITQPGVSPNDTQTTNCYKTSIANSGEVKVSVAALTTAGTSLDYNWQVNFTGPAGAGDDNNWLDVSGGNTNTLTQNMYILKPGTTSTTDVLELQRLVYFEEPGFRCIISGTNGEATVTTQAHYIYMTDVEGSATAETSTYDIAEDKWGDIPNRDIYVNDPVQSVIIAIESDVQRNTGQNGNNTYTWQKQAPGTSTWVDLTDPAPYFLPTEAEDIAYTATPETDLPAEVIELTLETPPLRADVDDGVKYRVKVESTSRFTLSGNTKTIIPYYSDVITINVYPTVYITNQPVDNSQFANFSTSFSVSATPSSGLPSDITYQWQYNTVNDATGWVNISNSSPYSGATTDLLTINPVPSTLTYSWFRCLMNITGGLASVTTDAAQLTLTKDYFTSISSLNDVVVQEFSNHTFTISASSVSAGPISYQWEKSTNFNPAQPSAGTWSTISGETSSSFSILSVTAANQAYYRVKCTTSGGEVLYSNAAQLTFQAVNITILQNTATTASVLEGETAALTLECEGISSIGTEVAYQWEIKRTGDSTFSLIGSGHNNSVDNEQLYVLRAQDNQTDNGAKIRCKLTAPNVPGQVYTNETTLTVIRRFTYFADVADKTVTIGDQIVLALNPSFTGGTPAYSWEKNGTAMGETGDVLVIPSVSAANNGEVYRCKITLTGCTQHRYARNNTVSTDTVSGPTYTKTIKITTTVAPSEPIYYSNQTAKTGAAVGSVICIPKPAGYVNDPAATADDAHQWGCARSGTAYPETNTADSSRTNSNKTTYQDGDVWTPNKPSWAANTYISPKWLLSKDRFTGYIEMRGQFLLAYQFPELARQFGTKFGGTITGTYPNYNSTDTFRMPQTYAKRLVGTGNVNNNSGSTSIVPTFDANGTSGGDKNVPGSMGGVYNYVKSAQLPPGSPGVAGEPDGTADGFQNAQTFAIGTYTTEGMDQVNAFAQPSFTGTVSYNVTDPTETFTTTPTHSHNAISVGASQSQPLITGECAQAGYPKLNPGGPFHVTDADGGSLNTSTTTEGESHKHTIETIGPGSFDMIQDAGMGIDDTTLRFTAGNKSIMNNNIEFFLRNNEKIPMNAPYFRLKYMIKAY